MLIQIEIEKNFQRIRLFAAMKTAFRPRLSFGLMLITALALFNLGVFGILLLSGNEIQRQMKENFEIQLYLDRELSPVQVKEIHRQLAFQSFISRDEQGKSRIRLVPKQEAAREFIRETGEDFYEFLGENPLRDAFHIGIKESQLVPDSLQKIKKKLSVIPGVFEVQYLENIAGSIEKNVRIASWVFLSAALVLLFTVFILLQTSIRTAIHSGRFFIRSMELIGASSWFIRRPYVLSIGFAGLAGGVLACALLIGLSLFSIHQVPEISTLIPQEKSLILCCLLIPAGFLICFFPALMGIKAYQRRKAGTLYQF